MGNQLIIVNQSYAKIDRMIRLLFFCFYVICFHVHLWELPVPLNRTLLVS